MATSTRGPRQFQGLFDTIAAKATVNIGDLAAAADLHLDVTIAGAQRGDFVMFSPDVDVVNVILTAQVTADNVVTVSALNETGDHIDLASGTWNFLILRPKGIYDSL